MGYTSKYAQNEMSKATGGTDKGDGEWKSTYTTAVHSGTKSNKAGSSVGKTGKKSTYKMNKTIEPIK